MKRGRNKTPAERALELICAKANLSYEEFIVLVEKSQGEKASPRHMPEGSYDNIKLQYVANSGISESQWRLLLAHILHPKSYSQL